MSFTPPQKNHTSRRVTLVSQLFLLVFLSFLVTQLIFLYFFIRYFDLSTGALDIRPFLILSLVLILLTSALLGWITVWLVTNSYRRPIQNLMIRLINSLEDPKHADRWVIQHFSKDKDIQALEQKANEVVTRWVHAQKTLKGHESLLDLRAEERSKEISQLINYDVITELPNRKMLKEKLADYIEQGEKEHKNVALLILLLADFHEINNAFGQNTGYLFLKEVAKHLSDNAPAGACVAHLSTSQFAIAKGGLSGAHPVANLAQWIIDMFTRPILINEKNIVTRVNIGAAIFPIDGNNPDVLMNAAHMALNRAKAGGPNSYQFYEANMNQITETRRTLLVDLHYALERNELLPFFQPQIDLKTNKITGVEALIRWNHPEKGLIPPGFFIPLAEESGLIIPIGEWMLRASCEQGLKWQALGLPPLTIAVNLSSIQFKQRNIVEIVNHVLVETGLPQDQLELEITEGVIMDNVAESINIMKAFRGIGISLAIDDFGTGYSSLNYLRRFPVQKVKIDQSFVRDIGSHETNQEKPLTDIILLLAENLNLLTIAEGIETEEQAQYLRERGCHEGQGYLFGKPMPADEFVQLFKAWG